MRAVSPGIVSASVSTGRPAGPLALYVKHLSLVAEFWLNGSLLNPGARYDAPDGRMGSQMDDAPLFLILPAGLFHVGENEFDVHLQGDARIRSGLSPLLLGPPGALRRDWRWRYTLQVVVPYVVLVVMGGAACFLFAHLLHQRRRHVIQFGMLVGLLSIVSYLSLRLPMSRADLQVLRVVVTTAMYWALCVAGYRIARVSIRGFALLQHGVPLVTIGAAVGVLVAGGVTDRIWLITWPHIAVRAVVIALVLRRAWLDRSLKLAFLGASATLWLATVAQSIGLLSEWLPWDVFRWSTVGAAPFCLVLLFLFAERFILDHEEAILEQRAAVTAERERILQDMHDGMGAHLITALHLARRDDVDRTELARSIEESLHDLRLIIDSLDLTSGDLLPLLSNLRFRLEPRLKTLGIQLAWDVAAPLPELDYLTPEAALAILRIVQEAINNALRHAHAAMVRIAIRAEEAHLLVEISDDGRGFVAKPAADAPGSRGLRGMRLRAARLGARLDVASGAGGTTVSLRLPRGTAASA